MDLITALDGGKYRVESPSANMTSRYIHVAADGSMRYENGAYCPITAKMLLLNDWERVLQLPEPPEQHEWLKVGDIKPRGYQYSWKSILDWRVGFDDGGHCDEELHYCAPIIGSWAYASAHLDADDKMRCACWEKGRWIQKVNGIYYNEHGDGWAFADHHRTARNWEIYIETVEGSGEWAEIQMNAGHKIICDQFKIGKYAHKENGIIQYCDGAYCDWEYWINEEGITFRLYIEPIPTQEEIDAAYTKMIESLHLMRTDPNEYCKGESAYELLAEYMLLTEGAGKENVKA